MDKNESGFPETNLTERAKKTRVFEIRLSEGRKLELREGNIADTEEESLFVLNLSDTEFPEPGPVFGAIYKKDEELKEKDGRQGKKVWDIMKETAPKIPNAVVSKVKDDLSGLEYKKATFPSSPYQIMELDITEANWPHLKKIYFGNIGPSGEGILVNVWRPTVAQEPKLREELTILLNNLLNKVEVDPTVLSVAMPVLTGNRATSVYFYEVLSGICKTRKIPVNLVVYALKNEDYEQGTRVLQSQFKS